MKYRAYFGLVWFMLVLVACSTSDNEHPGLDMDTKTLFVATILEVDEGYLGVTEQ